MPLDYEDRTDFENAERGLIDKLDPCIIKDADGKVVWDLESYSYLDGERPETVHPSLWRQAQLLKIQGLFEVTEGIYQVRGLDLSNITFVEGDTGVIAIDPLISAECAAAALALYRKNRGDRPISAVIYTHSHADHFGGVKGILPDGAGDVPIIAPVGFLEHAVSENVYAGVAMNRRAAYMYGSILERSATGQVSTGLGLATSEGALGLLAPTVDITTTGEEHVIDGVRIVFQMTPGTEAPSEMNFHFPDRRALCMAENATHNLHNLLTLRGAQVRDPRIWSHYLDEAVELYAEDSDVVFASHHWPTWGTAELTRYLREQRDFYAYLHDQTVRMLNSGMTGMEIAEDFPLPDGLDSAWHTRGYYGSVSHNVKAIYQRYLGWYDGNPSSLWQHPPAAAASRYVEAIGGREAILAKAAAYADDGDLRFAAELLKHAVFDDPSDEAGKHALADVYERLGYGAENATWRSFYLAGAEELRKGVQPLTISDLGAGMAAALTVEQLFDTLAIRIDGPKAAEHSIVIDLNFTDGNGRVRLSLSNGALIQTPEPRSKVEADLTLTLTKMQLLGLMAGQGLGDIEQSGDTGVLVTLLGLLDTPDPVFAIVTP